MPKIIIKLTLPIFVYKLKHLSMSKCHIKVTAFQCIRFEKLVVMLVFRDASTQTNVLHKPLAHTKRRNDDSHRV